ncbi:MAG: hypothetical protein ACJ8GN_07995 [Longimicrobiaceae bacterium]
MPTLLLAAAACEESVPGSEQVIETAKFLPDTSGLTNPAQHQTEVRFGPRATATVNWTTARQGAAQVVSGIRVAFPSHPASEKYSAAVNGAFADAPVADVTVAVQRARPAGLQTALVFLKGDGQVGSTGP